MARARNIKPGFYKNEDLAECSIWARFIFPGLWMLADREGRLEDRPKRIKGELLPFDSQDAEPLLVELAARGFIERYEVEGRAFIQITAFSKHQNPHHREPESDIPSPQSPRLSTHGTDEKPEALPSCKTPKARGKPEASPRLDPPKSDLEGGVNPADSLIPDSGFLIPDSGSSVAAGEPLSRETPPELNATSPEASQSEKPIDAAATTRKGELCRKLRSLGFDAAPHLDAWAEILRGHSDDEIMAVAETARERKPGERLHLNYLLPMLRDKAAPKPTKAKEPPWWSSESAMLAKGKELGMAPWGGESWQQFRGRIDAKLAERAAA